MSENIVWKKRFTFGDLRLVLPIICELASKHEHIRICQSISNEEEYCLETGEIVEEGFTGSGGGEEFLEKCVAYLKERRIMRSLK